MNQKSASSPSRDNNNQIMTKNNSIDESLDYSSNVDSDSYYHDGSSILTGGPPTNINNNNNNTSSYDATDTVREMHLALLYLLSNSEEFKKALHTHPPRGATTLAEWNAEYEVDDDESVMTSTTVATPLPFVVFADDAEVVLPQAHTASQLFGIERVEGIELEAAAGIPALSQLFLRWLALMPGGDHLNIIDPPGLTVMRIAGGRYRVTGAHRVVWTWMNEFAPLAEDGEIMTTTNDKTPLQVGDLVSMTIVDVFETDNQGKLLSYCPTFDNRAVIKTNQAKETIRKSSHKFFSLLGRAQKASSEVNKVATAQMKRMGIMQHARNVAENMKHRVDEAVQNYNSSPARKTNNNVKDSSPDTVTDSKEFEQAMNAAEAAATSPKKGQRSEGYISDDETGIAGEI
mmetsp:Transcript_1618/g.3975  ORF Transcript_1618/g.3975 Transcript_1618/m.3975 type:complete len:402 (-) Transcript_1618:149-1354(-)|eukprot:CAMPEP_0119555500 /NCGR_PEP_ID=MMETSP1352-20130426/7685_1 /TAXON_ID=265584 /ORGANISM="Stauroneis constricta, Strain CCMP1120" /LENGTH=401 /DNA_ID=CAMNT_0007602267 /DNA_START=317 /DNA_END=1522 /DNA_ORIENTATION=+